MSNDVHIAKVSKIQRSADISKGAVINSRRCMGRSAKGTAAPGVQDCPSQSQDIKKSEDVDYLFGSISPRGGVCGSATHLPGDIESPDHTQRDTNESDNNISSCSTLDIVNKVENLSVHQLETQVRELSQRLQQAEEQRADMQRKLDECNAEKELCFRRLEIVSAAHECRITEMHCVIAELSKKLRAKQECTILEEQEPEGSDLSYQEGSVYNSELNLTNPDAECQTDPLDGAEYFTGEGYGHDVDDNLCADLSSDRQNINETINKGQVEALQEEVLHLKAQIALLQSEISTSLRMNNSCQEGAVVEERLSVEYYGEDVEANESNCSLEQLCFTGKNKTPLNNLNKTNEINPILSLKHFEALKSPQKELPIPKMAERVKLRCASKNTGLDLHSNDLTNANQLENIDSDLKENNCIMGEFVNPLHLDNDLQRLQRNIDQLTVNNTVLTLTLEECKEHCDHLYLLCGKYESNAIALQTALNCSDRAIEAYDVMLALLESKLALMKDTSDKSAEESRKAVESVARHLLDRLESEKDICENSLGPWQNTFSIPEKTYSPWTAEDDHRLRYHVSKLKGRRSTIQNTIVNLESPFCDIFEKSRTVSENNETQQQEKNIQLDLEMAVLMQEVLSLREENIVLKTKAEEAERDRQHSQDRIGILQEALQHLQFQLSDDTNPLFHHQDCSIENRISYSEAEHAALTEQQLVEALSRESELKGRIQTLISSVTASQKISDKKYDQLHQNVRELQNSNQTLNQQLQQNKTKYQARIRKLEQRISEMSLELSKQQTTGCALSSVQQQLQRFKCKNSNTKELQNVDNVPETTL